MMLHKVADGEDGQLPDSRAQVLSSASSGTSRPRWSLGQSSLGVQLIASMVGLVILTAVSVGFIVYWALEAAIVPRGLARLEAHVTRLSALVEQRAAGSRHDLQAIARSSNVKNLVAAMTTANGRHQTIGIATWRQMVAQTFVAEVAAKPEFMQLRLIARDGQEVVRVDAGNHPTVSGDDELQNKADRAYVSDALALPTGEFYISAIDLNRERGDIELPTRPVLRVATPIDAPDGSRWGLAVVNLDLRPMLDQIRRTALLDADLYVVNEAGDFIIHPDRAKEFSFEFGRPRRIQDEMPKLYTAFGGFKNISNLARSAEWDSEIAAAISAVLIDPLRLVVIAAAPDRSAVAGATVQRSALIGGAIAGLIAIVLAVFLARLTTRPLAAMTRAVLDGGDSAALPVGSAGEVGILARALARYIDNERWHGAVVDNAHEAFLSTAPDGTIKSCNKSAERLFGIGAQDAIGRPADSLVDSEHAGALRDLLGRVASGQDATATYDVVLHGAHGKVTDVLMHISPVRTASGNLMGASILARDVTDERSARESFRVATEFSPAGMILIDAQGEIILVNAEAQRCFGYSRKELLGGRFDLLVPEDNRPAHDELVTEYLGSPGTRAMGSDREVFGRRKDGTAIPLEILLTTVPSREGLLVLAAIVDVSERRDSRLKLEQRTRELERSNADLLQFAYVASHDMQEPLRITASFAQLLSDRYQGQLDEKADKYIHYIVDGARRMQTLINDILVYSRLGAEDEAVGQVDLGEVIAETRAQLASLIEENQAQIVVEGELPIVPGDQSQLVRLFANLVGNAIKYRSAELPLVTISANRREDFWHIAVRDNGGGFDEKYKHKIFQMFQRIATPGSARGSGLGLAIAKRIVDQHGGDIWATSKVGEGSTFEFTIPGLEP